MGRRGRRMNRFAASRRDFLRTAGFTAGSCLLSAPLRAAGIPEPSAGDAPADYTLHIKASALEIAPKRIAVKTFEGQPGHRGHREIRDNHAERTGARLKFLQCVFGANRAQNVVAISLQRRSRWRRATLHRRRTESAVHSRQPTAAESPHAFPLRS